jgi:cytochrome c5
VRHWFRRSLLALWVPLLLCGCGADPFSSPALEAAGARYLDDARFRRDALSRSLTNPENAYSQERLGAYGTAWEALPVWNPRSTQVAAGEGPDDPLDPVLPPLWSGTRPGTSADWLALGRAVFFGYPLRAEPALATALTDPARAEALGLEPVDGVYPGLVRFYDVDGATRIGITCALCHAAPRDGALVIGAAHRSFDFGRLLLWQAESSGAPLDPELAARMGRWGPGRADITEDREEDPVAIPDLWGLRDQEALTQAATLKQDGPVALALREETQLITSNHQRVRPPRELAWALALYVYSLDPPLRASSPDPRGAAIFQSNCRRCHSNRSGGGPPVDAHRVGTDPALALGGGRGTGLYRPPALVDVADAGPYLHHGAVATLEALFSPARFAAGYVGPLGVGAVPGHDYGTDLTDDDRAALIRHLRAR